MKKSPGGKTRIMRINDEIMKETAQIVRGELKDPRISTMVSVTKVDTTSDLSYCKIFVSILGSDEQKADVMEGLKNASGFIRSRLASALNLRNTPVIKFMIDDSMEHALRISAMIDEVNKGKED